jgi:predicted metal-dependent peptidase
MKVSMQLQDSLAKASKDLMLKEPFYGLFLIQLNKEWSEAVPTAGVRLKGINYELLINPIFWEKLSPEHRMGLLKHELN